MREKHRSLLLLALGLLEIGMLLGASQAQSTPDTQLRYKVYYQCNGERVQVDHCRKDDDGLGYGPPTKPQENYCLVYYPDRPRSSRIMVQTAELYDDIVKKLQACGALVNQNGSPSASTQTNSSGLTAAKFYFSLANQDYDKKDYPKAIEGYKRAISANPDAETLYLAQYRIGWMENDLKEYSKSVSPLREAIRLKPEVPAAHYELGYAFYALDLYPEAISEFGQAGRLKPDYAGAYQYLGKAYVALSKKQDKAKNLDLALQACSYLTTLKAPVDKLEYANYQIGWIHDESGRYEKAIPFLREAIRLKPDDAIAADELGYAYMQFKQYPDAVAAFQQAIRLKPDYASAQYNLGATYVRMGNKNGALQVYKTLLALDKARAQRLYDLIYSGSGGSQTAAVKQ